MQVHESEDKKPQIVVMDKKGPGERTHCLWVANCQLLDCKTCPAKELDKPVFYNESKAWWEKA